MGSALIVYGSTTGNTEYVADVLERVLGQAGFEVTKASASDVKANALCAGYDLVLFGCSTWGDDSIELQDDFVPLFDDFETIGAKGKATAVFGCGDSGYAWFCGAVDAIAEKLEAMGASVLDTLKIDGSPQSEKTAIEDWGKALAAKIS